MFIGVSRNVDKLAIIELTYIVPLYAKAWALGLLEDQSFIYSFQTNRNIPVHYPASQAELFHFLSGLPHLS